MAKKPTNADTEIKLSKLLSDDTEVLPPDPNLPDDSYTTEPDEYEEEEEYYEDEDEDEDSEPETPDDGPEEEEYAEEDALQEVESRDPEVTSLDTFSIDPAYGVASDEDTDKYYKATALAPEYPNDGVPETIPISSPVKVVAIPATKAPGGKTDRQIEREKRLLSIPTCSEVLNWLEENCFHLMCGVTENQKRICHILNKHEHVIGSGPSSQTAAWAAGLKKGKKK